MPWFHYLSLLKTINNSLFAKNVFLWYCTSQKFGWSVLSKQENADGLTPIVATRYKLKIVKSKITSMRGLHVATFGDEV